MTVGASLLLIALGAILKWAITDNLKGVDLGMIGVILMVIGVVGLIIGIGLMMSRRRTDIVRRPGRTTYIEPNDPVDPRL